MLYDGKGRQLGAVETKSDPEERFAAYTFDLTRSEQRPGNRVTITAIYNDQILSVSHVLRRGSQWVNIGVAAWEIDRDGKSDLGVFQPDGARWRMSYSSQNAEASWQFGQPMDTPVPSDYDRDGIIDVAVFNAGRWSIWESMDNQQLLDIDLGAAGDLPVPGDYYGDGRADLAVFQPQSGMWLIRRRFGPVPENDQFGQPGDLPAPTSVAEIDQQQFGQPGDLPVPADYDGDHVFDLAVFRPTTGTWYIRGSLDNQPLPDIDLGTAGDLPVPADYDGDGKADLAVFRPSTGQWQIRRSSDAEIVSEMLGQTEDRPVPADYDGDGKANLAVFRPFDRTWYISDGNALGGISTRTYGWSGDIPLPGAYIPVATP
ncbi:MAG TPA: VCBS repeat-containing protein [Herpetosiphonaceae bacterium]